jgi:UDP-N-acetylglucosamine enolpyruvyl transferase
LLIRGPRPLAGSVAVAAAENATLPIMAESLLTAEPARLQSVSPVQDVRGS